jgi:hypothetical protein
MLRKLVGELGEYFVCSEAEVAISDPDRSLLSASIKHFVLSERLDVVPEGCSPLSNTSGKISLLLEIMIICHNVVGISLACLTFDK